MTHDSVSRQTVTVNSENGLHLVPCSQIAQLAQKFSCQIRIRKQDADTDADAKNIFDLMSLGAAKGTVLILEAEGPGAEEALPGLTRLFETSFEGEHPES